MKPPNEPPPPESGANATRPAARNGRILVGEKVYIRKRGTRGLYVAEFWHERQNRRRALKTADRAIAERKARRLEADLLAGTYAAPRPPVSLADAVEEYLEVKEGEARKATTIAKYRQWLKSFAAFAEQNTVTTLRQITASLFERYRAHRKPSQSAKSLHTGLTIVKSFIKWCAAPGRDYLDRNPVAGCKLAEPYAHPKFSPKRKQVRKILARAPRSRRAQFALLAYTGLRAGEMRMLRPNDVDL
ncbi:MAG TPA: site-specific integrase, partial [Tepidisphaeraceae bacterium]